ncbi:hypothetical protein [Bradyrhizobium sp.]
MATQDRVLTDLAATPAASSPRKASELPTSEGHALKLARIGSVATSGAAAVSVFMGTLPASGSGDIKGYALSIVAAATLGLASASIWHVLHGVAAHAKELHKQSIALAFAVGMFGFGSLTSGSFLAANVGGAGAIQTYQHQAVDKLKKTAEIVAYNAASDAPLLAAVEHGGEAFARAAGSEASAGAVSPRHKAGQGPAFGSIINASENTRKVAAKMRERASARASLLRTAQAAMTEASNTIATGDAAQFEDAYTRASQALSEAEKIRLSAEASSLGVGWIVHSTAAPFINGTLQDIEKARQLAAQNWRAVSIPTYMAISERDAVVKNPPFLAWVCALLIEAAPLVMLGLLLLLWRKETPEQDDGRRLPFDALPAPTLAPAE